MFSGISVMTAAGGGGKSTSGGGGGGGFTLKFFTAQHHQQKSMDLSKFLLCFLILFNVPFSEKGGVGVVNNVASGTLISISTSKGSIILQKDGETTSVLSSSVNVPVGNTNNNKRWNHYETALSNTWPLGPDGVEASSSTTTSTTSTTATTPTEAPLSTDLTASPSSSLEIDDDLTSNSTRKPLSGGRSSGNKTYHNKASSNTNTNLLNNARKYIASYEDLQSRFPDGSPFENNTSINMTVPLGDTAFMRCRVRNLGERSISWIRRRDWHILTTGKTTYTNDERFNVLHVDGTEDWTLQIKFLQKRDNGTYECQVSTGTGIISYFVNLFIAVPEAFILGNGEYHVEQGSNINLVCVIEKSPKPPEFIFWYHNERMINYGNSREVVVRTEPGARTHSRLTIKDARIADTGNYTCKTAHAEPASIFVYVSQASGLFSGDKMAAIQRRKTAGTASTNGDSTSVDTSPVQQSSAASSAASVAASAGGIMMMVAVVVALTAMTTYPTTSSTTSIISIFGVCLSLTVSSIQQLSSISWQSLTGFPTTTTSSKTNKMISSAAHLPPAPLLARKSSSGVYCWWYAFTTANFLLSLVLFLMITGTNVVGDVAAVAVTTFELLLSLLFLPILAAGASTIPHVILEAVQLLILRLFPPPPSPKNRHPHHRHHDYCSSANCVSFTLQTPEQVEQQGTLQKQWQNVEQKKCRPDYYEGGDVEIAGNNRRRHNHQKWLQENNKHERRRPGSCWWWWLRRHFVIFTVPTPPQHLGRLEVVHYQLFLLSSFSSKSMNKSLPVFLSIAQSLWTPPPAFPTLTTTVTAAVVANPLLLQKEKKRRSHFLQPSSNRLAFRTISHLLIFPQRESTYPVFPKLSLYLYPVH